jgi:hypothetical protein
VTLELDPDHTDGYRILETVTFDPAPALEMLRGSWPDAVVAVEELGVGFKVSAPFPDGELDGEVRVVPWEDLGSSPATRVTFRSPTGTAEDFLALVERIGLHEVSYAVGFTAWLDINPPRPRRWSRSAAGWGSSPCTRSRSATSATTSRCCSGPHAVSRWAMRPMRSRPPLTKSPSMLTRTGWFTSSGHCSADGDCHRAPGPSGTAARREPRPSRRRPASRAANHWVPSEAPRHTGRAGSDDERSSARSIHRVR